MRHQIFVFVLTFCLSWVLYVRADAQCNPVRDQGQIFNTTGIISAGTHTWSQSITAGFLGQLVGIQFQIENAASELPASFIFCLHEGGNPTSGEPIFEQQLTLTIDDLDDSGSGIYTWDVSDTGALFNAGDMFTFSFSVQQPGIEIAGNQDPGYDGGDLFIDGNPLPPDNPIRDMAFISYACIEPGPMCNTQQSFKLLPDDGAPGDHFGVASICGNFAIVGCSRDDDNGEDSGSAYVFDVATGNEVWKLLPDDGAAGDRFGSTVSVSGNIALVGAPGVDSVYLFNVASGQQITKLVNDGEPDASFGGRVAVYDTMAIISGREAAYLFDVSTGQQLAILLPNDGEEGDLFGNSLAIGNNAAIVGAWRDDDYGYNNGSAYLFDIVTGQQLFKLLPPTTSGSVDHFGYSVAISGNVAIVGAPDYDAYGSSSGAAFLFDTSTGQQIGQLIPTDGAVGDEFGKQVAIDGNIAIVAAPYNDDNSGSAYLFDVTTGLQIGKLNASDGWDRDRFGLRPISLDGNSAIVGAERDDDNGEYSGSAYLFDISDCLPGEPITSLPDSVLVTRGNHISGGVIELADSDNADLSIQRATADIQSRTELEAKGVSPVASPSSLEVTLEGSVFARSQVYQTIELYDYVAGVWEQVDARAATRFTDSTVTVAATGDLSRFVEGGTMFISARIRYQSPVARQQFSSNTDQLLWTIGQ